MSSTNPGPFGLNTAASSESAAVNEGLRSYMLGVYNYMASALALTGIFAYLTANFAPLTNLVYNIDPSGQMLGMTGLGWVIMFAPIAMVFFLSFKIQSLRFQTAQMIFWGYAALMGMSLSSILFIYTGASITKAFFVTAGSFGALSLYGYTTKRDLSNMGKFLFMGLIGLILASLANMFFKSSGFELVLSVIGVLIFAGLTIYDTQKLKTMYYATAGNAEAAMKTALMGALSLYLDFINLFLYLLRFMGDRR